MISNGSIDEQRRAMRLGMVLVVPCLLVSFGLSAYLAWDDLFENNTPPNKTNTERPDLNSYLNSYLKPNSVDDPGGIPAANAEDTEGTNHQPDSTNVEDSMSLLERRKAAIDSGDRAEARRLAIEIAERDGNGTAIRRFYMLAGEDEANRLDMVIEWPGKDYWLSIDEASELHLDMSRLVKEQTPESLSKLLEDAPDGLQKAVVRRLRDVLDDEGRESWFNGLKKHTNSTAINNAIYRDKSVYPALKEIEHARLSAYQALSDSNISDKEFVDGFLRGSTSYVGSVISPISLREDAASLLPSIIQDLEYLFETHSGNIGRRDCIALHIGRCDGLHDFLANRSFSLQDKRNLKGSAYWCWVSGIDGLVLARSGVHYRSSSKLQDEPWLVAASEMRSAELKLPVSSFQDAWDFVMPFFGIHGWGGSTNKAILTPEFLGWLESNWVTSKVRNDPKQLQLLFTTEGTEFTENSLKYTLSAGSWFFSHPLRETQPEIASDPAESMCPPESEWEDGERRDVMRFVSGRKPQSKILAKTIARYLDSSLLDQPAEDSVVKLICTLFEAPTHPDWTPIEYDLFGNGQYIVNLWSEKEAKSKLFAELASMKYAKKAKEYLRSKAKSAALASTNEDWKKLLNWLLDEWE